MRAVLVTVVTIAAALGCSPGGRAADAEATDRASLRQGVASDEQVVALLRPVDDLALKGKPDEAVARLESEVRPASQRSLALVKTLAATSPWGQGHRQTLGVLVTDRAASLERYAAALRSNDLTAVVAALEEQQGLDRRGAALAAAVQAPAAP
ncbi:MAG: hypothetical protein EOO75_16515 [Myxococcales bacterium]|nr:MAG: hypothetical protein EOO75_16515 [Myxococcales bacterium]